MGTGDVMLVWFSWHSYSAIMKGAHKCSEFTWSFILESFIEFHHALQITKKWVHYANLYPDSLHDLRVVVSKTLHEYVELIDYYDGNGDHPGWK